MEAVLEQVRFMDDDSDITPRAARANGVATDAAHAIDVAAGGTGADRAMERYACGDDGAFVELYDELAPRLFGFALRWTHSRSAAEDIVQQTLLQIHAARHRFVRGGAVLPWAYAIARRLLIDLGRRGGREQLRAGDVRDPEDPAPTPLADEVLGRRELEAAAWRDLAALPAGWREAFELVKCEGLSVAETAEVLGITRATVKIRAFRATAALRAAATKRSGDDFQRGVRP